MDVFEAIRGRRSVRKYQTKEISEELITKLLSTAIMAPSAGNRQAWEFIIVHDPITKTELARAAYNQVFIANAPVIIVVCANKLRSAQRYGSRGAELYCIQDSAAAIQNLLLAAYSLGLGTCWVGAFNESMVSKLLEIPEEIRPVALIPIGYSAQVSHPPPRLPLEQVIHREQY
ncbi:MAG: nitroreductase family protein [Candidatus Heimdallarchaeota archaeon]